MGIAPFVRGSARFGRWGTTANVGRAFAVMAAHTGAWTRFLFLVPVALASTAAGGDPAGHRQRMELPAIGHDLFAYCHSLISLFRNADSTQPQTPCQTTPGRACCTRGHGRRRAVPPRLGS